MKSKPQLKRTGFLLVLGLFLSPGFFASPASAAVNDNIVNAVDLRDQNTVSYSTVTPNFVVSTAAFPTTTANQALESGEDGGCRTVSRSVWYKYVSTTAMILNMDTIGSDYDTVLGVWKATSTMVALMSGLSQQVACDDDSAGNVKSKITNVSLSRNTTYFFQLSAYSSGGSGGTLVFTATFTPTTEDLAPPSASIQQPGPNIPTLTNLPYILGNVSDNVGVSRVSVKMSSGGAEGLGPTSSHFDFYLWSWVMNCSTCSGDAYLYSGVNSSTTTWDKYLPTLVDGSSYFIRVTAYDSSGNSTAFDQINSTFIFSSPNVPNDSYLNPKIIKSTDVPYVDISTTTSATYSTQISPSCSYGAANRDVWYKYISTSTSGLEVRTLGSNHNTILAVWRSTGETPGANPPYAIPVSTAGDLACSHPYTSDAYASIQLQNTVTYFFQVMSDYGNGGQLKFNLSLQDTDATPPSPVTTLSATGDVNPGSVKLQWTAVGDDGGVGRASSYDIRFATIAISNLFTSFSSMTPITSSPTFVSNPTPSTAAAVQTQYLYGLPYKTTVYFLIRTYDESFNSSLSNAATAFVPGTLDAAANLSLSLATSVVSVPYSDEKLVTSGAGADWPPPCGPYIYGTDRNYWFKYISAATTNYVANTFNSNFDTVLTVYSSTGSINPANVPIPSSGTSLGCSNNELGTQQSRVNFSAIQGTTYYFQVMKQAGVNGTLRFQLGAADSIKPGSITSLVAQPGAQNGEVNLSWIEPADDGYAGSPVSGYLVRYSSASSISSTNFDSTGTVFNVEAFPLYQNSPVAVLPGAIVNYVVRNLTQGSTYWFSVRSMDTSGNVSNPSNSPFARSMAPTAQPGDGEGSIQIRDAGGSNILTSVPISSNIPTINMRFTVGASSMAFGGRISIRFPEYWTPPCFGCGPNPGLVTVSTITASIPVSQLSVEQDYSDYTGRTVMVKVSSTILNAGDIINIAYSNVNTQYNKQNNVQFVTKTRGSNSGTFQAIASQPSINVVGGSPIGAGFTETNFITLGADQISPPLLVEPKDQTWQGTTADRNMYLRVFTLKWDSTTYTMQYDTSAQISKDAFQNIEQSTFSFSTAAFQAASWNYSLSNVNRPTYYNLIIPAGAASVPIYYRTSTRGETVLWIEYNGDFAFGASTSTFSRWMKILPNAVGFSGLTVSPATISPDNDGAADFANINFTPTNSDMQWRVRIGTDPVLSNLTTSISSWPINVFLDWWGYGQPPGITWYGTDFSGRPLSSGTYIVRLEDSAGTVVSSTTLTIQSAFLDVYVEKSGGGPAVVGADVTVNGQSGGGYIYRTGRTGANGIARIWGLKAGNIVTANANYYDFASAKSFYGSHIGQPIFSTGTSCTVTFSEPARIRVHASLPLGSESTYDQWGGVNVTDNSSGFSAGFGSLRIPNNSLESDDGWNYTGFPSSWTTLNVTAAGGGTSFKIRVDAYGFTPVEFNATVAGGSTADFVVNLVKKPRIYGMIVLPSTNSISSYGTWVSVEGRKSTQTFPTAWGGAWFPAPQAGITPKGTGYFTLDVDLASTYLIKARAQGIGTIQTSVLVGTNSVGSLQVDDTNTVEGGNKVVGGVTLAFSTTVPPGITGNITVDGDTMDKSNPMTLYLNAFSPTNYSYAFIQSTVATHGSTSTVRYEIKGVEDGEYQMFTYLEGFELSTGSRRNVTVVNGRGDLSITLKKFSGSAKVFFSTGSNLASSFDKISLRVGGTGVSFSTDSATQGYPSYKYYLSSGEVTIPNLGTGFYDFSAAYKNRYLTKKMNILNGQNVSMHFDFTQDVFTVTGTVKVQAFTYGVTQAFQSGIRINTVGDLVDRSKIGFEQIYVGSGNINVPIVRIEAHPKDRGNFGQGISNFVSVGSSGNVGNAGGFSGSQFNSGQVRFGIVDSSGNWTIDNLLPGVYVLRHPVDLDRGASYYTSTVGGSFETNASDVANEQKTVLISTMGVITVIEPQGGNLEFTYEGGSQVSGQILLPSNVASDTRFMTLVVLNNRKEIVSWQSIYLNGNSANYNLTNLGDGDYTLILNDEKKGNESNPDSFVQNTTPGQAAFNYEKYVARPLGVSIKGSNLTGQNIQLERAGFIEGKIAVVRISSSGVKSTELITDNNKSLLPSNFQVFAFQDSINREAKTPDSQCQGNNCSLVIDSTKGTFRISRLFPNIDTNLFLGASDTNNGGVQNELGQGKLSVASVEKTGYTVSPGQVLDVGTIELQQGLTITGSVQGLTVLGATIPVANVRIETKPVGIHRTGPSTFTDEKGSFTISGLNPDTRYYNFIFAARDERGDNSVDFDAFSGLTGIALQKDYAEKVKRNVDIRKSTNTVDVILDLGRSAITIPAGGPALRMATGDQIGFPGAEIVANKVGDIPIDNPLGDIFIQTDVDGTFTMSRLAAGTYDFYAISLGYAVKKFTVNVASTDTSKDVGNVQLETGLELSGTIRKPDGSYPISETDISVLAAATPDFSELTIASLRTNPQTSTIDGYTLAGLKSGTTYQLLMFNHDGETIVPPEHYPSSTSLGVAITTDTTLNLTFTQSAPQILVKAKKTGTQSGGFDQYRFEFQLTQALRNKTIAEKSDDYWQSVVSILSETGGTGGALSADPNETNPIDPSRKKLIVLYTPGSAATTKVRLRLRAPTSGLEGASTSYYVANFTCDYYLGLAGQKLGSINMSRGDTLAIEGDDSSFGIPPGAFKEADGTDLDVSSTVSVGLQKASDVATSTTTALGAPAFSLTDSELDEAMPPVLARAMKSMREIQGVQVEPSGRVMAAPGIKGAASLATDVTGANVLSAFYDLFLPAGVRRQLAKNATVTIFYTSSTADTSNMNVYFFNDTAADMLTTSGATVPAGGYGLEANGKVLNSDNNTISVNVNHFTTFVVVNSTETILTSASILGSVTTAGLTVPSTTDFTGSELEAFNFPNPFNATARGFTFSGTKTSGTQTLATTGSTAIRFALPSNLGAGSVRVTCEIFDVAGDLVKRLDFASRQTGKYHYGDWDGRNENGETVASGVYIGRISIEGSSRTKTFKMAVIK